jgi:hypothetical protein
LCKWCQLKHEHRKKYTFKTQEDLDGSGFPASSPSS